MKILESLIKQQPENVHNQILGWLYWLKNYCNSRDCFSCEFYRVEANFFRCKIRNTYRDIIEYPVVPPDRWRLPQGHITPERPPKLDFLRDLRWDREGNPIPPPKGGE